MPLTSGWCQISRASESLLERVGGIDHRGHRGHGDGFPFSERAALGGHAELCPGATTALAAAAGGVQRGGIPLDTGAASGFAGREDFGWGGGEAAAGEVVTRKCKRIRLFSKIQNMLWDVQNTKSGGVIGELGS